MDTYRVKLRWSDGDWREISASSIQQAVRKAAHEFGMTREIETYFVRSPDHPLVTEWTYDGPRDEVS